MFTRRKKIGSDSAVIKPDNRLLRLFRSDVSFQSSPASMENADQRETFSEDRKMIRAAMFEAEYMKAKAVAQAAQHQWDFR